MMHCMGEEKSNRVRFALQFPFFRIKLCISSTSNESQFNNCKKYT